MVVFNQQFREDLRPSDLNWIILNHLSEFDSKPGMVKAIYDKITEIKNHPLTKEKSHPIVTEWDFYNEALNKFYPIHNKFPDIKYLQYAFKQKGVKIENGNYSSHIYDAFITYLDDEMVKTIVEHDIVNAKTPDMKKYQEAVQKVCRFIGRNCERIETSKDFLLNLYDEYSKSYNGVRTYIKTLDECIGIIGFRSICAIGAPSGHGKTALSCTIAYNAAVFGGHCVDYNSFEVPLEHIWFNLVSIESQYLGINLVASEMKECALRGEEPPQFRECMASLLKKISKSGGYINIVDYTTLEVSSFDEFMDKLESIAEERQRPADLVIVDNIDKVNNMIIGVDKFCKTYYSSLGTTFILLTQLNRDGMFKLDDAKEESTAGSSFGSETKKQKKKVSMDFTVFKEFSSLYERAVTCLVVHANAKMRNMETAHIYPVKLRNRPVPENPLKVAINYAYSLFKSEPRNRDNSEAKGIKSMIKAGENSVSTEIANSVVNYDEALED